MATITITVQDAVAAEVQEAICDTYGYDPKSGVTKAQFVKDHLRSHLLEVYQSYKAVQAANAARDAATLKAKTDFG